MRSIVIKNVPDIIDEYRVKRINENQVVVVGTVQPFKSVQFKLDPYRSKQDWYIDKHQNGMLHLKPIK
jgi:hypothetical protein